MMDSYAVFFLSAGAVLGFCTGFCLHALYMRWWLRRNIHRHPEYRMFMELMEGNVDAQSEEKEKGQSEDTK